MLFQDQHHGRLGTIYTSILLNAPLCHRYHENFPITGRVSLEFCASDHLPQHVGRHVCGDSDELFAPLRIGVWFVGRVSIVVPGHRGYGSQRREEEERLEEILVERVQWLHEGGTRLRCWEETDFDFATAFPDVVDGHEQKGWEFGIDGLHQVREREVLPSSFCHGFGSGRSGGGVESARVEHLLRPVVEVEGVDVDVEVCEGVEGMYWPFGTSHSSCLKTGERQLARREGEIKLRQQLHDIATQQMITRIHRHGLGVKMMAIAHLHHHSITAVALDVVCNLPKQILYDKAVAFHIDVKAMNPTLSSSLQDLRTEGMELSLIENCSACVDHGPRHEHRTGHPLHSPYGLDGHFQVFDGCHRLCVETAAVKQELPPAFNFRLGTLVRAHQLRVKFAVVVEGQKMVVEEEEVSVEVLGPEAGLLGQWVMVGEERWRVQGSEVQDVAPPRYEDVFRGQSDA